MCALWLVALTQLEQLLVAYHAICPVVLAAMLSVVMAVWPAAVEIVWGHYVWPVLAAVDFWQIDP